MNKKNFALYLGFILIIALAFFLRLYRLDERVFHHDEAAVGYFTYKLFNDGIYSYDPSFHGPFMYYAAAGMFRLFGDSDYSARLLPALLGAAMLFLLIPLRRHIGNAGMIFAAFFLALSPSFLYYSRFYREDIFAAFFSMLMLVCAVKYAEKHVEEKYSSMRVFYLFAGATSLASMAALKENAYIAMGLIALFLLLLFIRERWYKDLIGKIKRCEKRLMITVAEGAFFILVLLVAFSLFYTGKPLDIHGMYAAVEKAVSHWYEMHMIQRMGGPIYFYLPILALYELPVLVFGLLGIIHYYKKNSLFMIFIGYWAITNLIIYSYLQEKVPWLILNPLLPLAIIAAGYIGEILPRLKFNSIVGSATIIFLVISSSYFVYSSVLLNYYNYTNPAEPLIQAAQPPQKFSLFLDKINEISLQYQNKSTELQLTDVEMETQFLWYMRHFSNIKWRVSIDSELTAPLIVVHDTDGNESEADIVKRHLRTDYERLDSAKMSWYWFLPSDVTLDYLLYRKMDRAPGEYRVVLFYKPKN
ncbi:MAG: TIGR03663 family protein [Euryarchaeota archaeon]|nr:TIGR03663 family protein [Euryarchaeota archaeon]MBU4491296.1 TIGR03663 family protein [Euryarchaeota archaeon]MCG2728543.1 TIGR03663 family protein [Candidatus Methanoperedenaceae archaeon]